MRIIFPIILSAIAVTTSAEDIVAGAVVTNGPTCAKIGVSILEKNGTAVEAAIAALLCEGVSIPNCMGLGGGFFMSIYIKENNTHEFLNSREVAPKNTTKDMYGSDENLALYGGLAVGVPGELKGYWAAYKKYGGLVEWKDLVQPTIDLCKNGILVTEYLEKVLASQKDIILKDDLLRETFIDPTTNDTYVKNDTLKRPKLAQTLEQVAEYGPDILYNGNLTKDFVGDIANKGGIITEEDLKNYQPQWKEPIKIKLPFNQTLFAPPLPSSGVILGSILNILNDSLDFSHLEKIENWQTIIETFKFGFARRTELGDLNSTEIDDLVKELISSDFAKTTSSKIALYNTSADAEYYGAESAQPEDHGTANLCVLAPNGDAVVVTSTINTDFGAAFMSGSTGIILNNQMDDFSSPGFTNTYGVPPSPNNYIAPGKRPVSSMSPSIVTDQNGDVRLLIGGSGGTKIITSVALTMIKNLWFNYTIKDAVSDKRFHHQLFPMKVVVEKYYENDTEFLLALKGIGHDYEIFDSSGGFNTITSISRENGTIVASFDPRRGGSEEYIFRSGAFNINMSFAKIIFVLILLSVLV